MSPSRGIIPLYRELAQHRWPCRAIPLISARRWASMLPSTSFLEKFKQHNPTRAAVVHASSEQSYTYGRLLRDVVETQKKLKEEGSSQRELDGERIAFLMGNEHDYVVALLSIIASGAIAVPLAPTFPTTELQTILNDCSASMLLSSEYYHKKASEIVQVGVKKPPVLERLRLSTNPIGSSPTNMPILEAGHGIDTSGLMLYTSGTTGRPKGVLLPQTALMAQCHSLIEAWKYSPQDHLLHVLPLHHIHGIINGLLAPLVAGSSLEFLYPFNPTAVWHRLAAPFLPQRHPPSRRVTIFTAVPTMYNRLLSAFPELPSNIQEAAVEAISPRNLRLTMSGSSALPTSIKTVWTKLSKGNVLLERYGMTEIGMALSCGLDMEERVDGSVGWPLPSVKVRLLDTEMEDEIQPSEEFDADGKEREGEILVHGPTVFQEYWQKEDKTREAFIVDKDTGKRWFRTGDVAVRRKVVNSATGKLFDKGPMYFIRGRKDVDIIKTGGEKVSALEVEREILSLPGIAEVAVVAVPSSVWGQKVAAVIVLHHAVESGSSNSPAKPWTPVEIRRALKSRLASFKIPQVIKILKGPEEQLPRNAMGKVNKKRLVEQYWGSATDADAE